MVGYPISTRELEEIFTGIDAEVHRSLELLGRLMEKGGRVGSRLEEGKMRGSQDYWEEEQIPCYHWLKVAKMY